MVLHIGCRSVVLRGRSHRYRDRRLRSTRFTSLRSASFESPPRTPTPRQSLTCHSHGSSGDVKIPHPVDSSAFATEARHSITVRSRRTFERRRTSRGARWSSAIHVRFVSVQSVVVAGDGIRVVLKNHLVHLRVIPFLQEILSPHPLPRPASGRVEAARSNSETLERSPAATPRAPL